MRTCSAFEENRGNNGIFTVAYSPLSFRGTNKFIRNKGTDALKVSHSHYFLTFLSMLILLTHFMHITKDYTTQSSFHVRTTIQTTNPLIIVMNVVVLMDYM